MTFRLKGLHEVFETANWEKTEEARDVWAIRFNVYGGLLNELTALRKETDDAASENADDRDLTATLLDVEINARGHLLNMMTKTHDFTMATALLSEYKKATTRRFEISGDKKQLQTDEYRYRLWKRYIDVGARKIKQRSWMETWGFILAILIMIGIFSHLIIWNAFLQQLEDDRAERLKIQREQGVETGRFYF